MKIVKYIKEKVINQSEIGELDLKTPEEIIGNLDNLNDDEWFKIVEDEDSEFIDWRDNDYININLLLKELNKLKKQGSNYVQIYNHDDHHSYILTGVSLKEMSSDEINNQRKIELKTRIDRIKKFIKENRTKVIEDNEFIKQLEEEYKKLK